MRDRANLQVTRRKMRDRSIALVLVGIVALLPPVAGMALIDGTVAGIPIPVLYVFIVWTALIVGAAALAPALQEQDETGTPGGSDETER
ncbi:MAG: hypothetical protein AAGL24_02355 [Pseudomonadota bacterium]